MVQISQILIEPGHSVLKHEVFIKIHLDLASVRPDEVNNVRPDLN